MRSIKVATTISSAALSLCLLDRLTVKFFESDQVDQSTRNLPDSTKPKQYTASDTAMP